MIAPLIVLNNIALGRGGLEGVLFFVDMLRRHAPNYLRKRRMIAKQVLEVFINISGAA
jgi:hypothetical protein